MATVWSSSALASLSNIVKESMPSRIDWYLNDLSPTMPLIVRTSQGVSKNEWGEGWVLRKSFREGVAGAYAWDNMERYGAGIAVEAGGTAPAANWNIYGTTSESQWPSSDVSVSPGYFRWQTQLKQGLGNLYVPFDIIRAADSGQAVGDQVAATVEGTAENVAHAEVAAFFAESYTLEGTTYDLTFDGGVLGTFTAAGETIGSGASEEPTVTLTGGSVRRFVDGQRVDLFYISTETIIWINRRNSVSTPVYVDKSDTYADQINLIVTSGDDIVLPSATVVIVPYHAFIQVDGTLTDNVAGDRYVQTAHTTWYPNVPHCIEQVVKATGTIFGTGATGTPTSGITLSTHPRFRSYADSIGAALDEATLFRAMARQQHAKSGAYAVDMFITTEGVFSGYVDSLDGYYTWERNGRTLDLSGQGVRQTQGADLVFAAFGRTYKMRTDPFVGTGKCYGLVTRNNNWKRYGCPRLRNTTTGQEFPADVEFVAPLVHGSSTIFTGCYSSSGQLVDKVQAPFYRPYQIVPDFFPGMKLYDIVEDYGTAD